MMRKALAPLGLTPMPLVKEMGLGRSGFILPLSEHFGQQYSRLRMNADGDFCPCLPQDTEVPSLTARLSYIKQAIDSISSRHELAENHLPTARCMMQIGA